jgi:hypothetical protein
VLQHFSLSCVSALSQELWGTEAENYSPLDFPPLFQRFSADLCRAHEPTAPIDALASADLSEFPNRHELHSKASSYCGNASGE